MTFNGEDENDKGEENDEGDKNDDDNDGGGQGWQTTTVSNCSQCGNGEHDEHEQPPLAPSPLCKGENVVSFPSSTCGHSSTGAPLPLSPSHLQLLWAGQQAMACCYATGASFDGEGIVPGVPSVKKLWRNLRDWGVVYSVTTV